MRDPVKEMERIKKKHFLALPKSARDAIEANRRIYAEWWLNYYKTHGTLPREYGTTSVRVDP